MLFSLLFFSGCFLAEKRLDAKFNNPSAFEVLNANVTSVELINNQFVIKGTGLETISSMKLVNNGVIQELKVETASAGEVIANGITKVTIGAGKMFDMVLSNANASTTIPVVFTFDEGSVHAVHLNRMNANNGDILKWNGTAWAPTAASSSQNYRGTWIGTSGSQDPDLSAVNPNDGDYYIVAAGGTYHGETYTVGDWIIYSSNVWQRVPGAGSGDVAVNTVAKFKGGSNYVSLKASAALAADYTLTLPTGTGTSGQVLTTNGTGVTTWVSPTGVPAGAAGGDLSGTYPDPVITGLNATKVGSGNITNAEFEYLNGVTSNIQTQLNAKASSGNFITAITGDVTASGPGSATAVVAKVGGVDASDIAAAANLSNTATSTGTINTIVRRDSSGNFSGNLSGNSTNVTGVVAVSNGGTGLSSLTASSLLYGNGTSNAGLLATPTAESVMLSRSGIPTWVATSSSNYVLKTGASGALNLAALTLADLPSGMLSGAGTAGYVPYYDTTQTLANSPLSILSSKVGIGTASPQASLHIAGGGNTTTGKMVVLGDNTNLLGFIEMMGARGLIGYDGGNGAATFQGGAGKNIRFNVNSGTFGSGNAMMIDGSGTSTNGNVGIGTTTPTSKVAIVSSTYNAVSNPMTATNNSTTFTTQNPISLNAGDYILSTTSGVAQGRGVSVGGTSTSSFSVALPFSAAVTGELFTVVPPALNIDNGKFMVQGSTGYVGVGTLAPRYPLDVNGTVQAGDIRSTGQMNLTGSNRQATLSPVLLNLYSFTSGTSPVIQMRYHHVQAGAGTTLGTLAFLANNSTYGGYTVASMVGQMDAVATDTSMPSRLVFSTTPTGAIAAEERMRIDSRGYVGIGTGASGPTTRLQVAGDITPATSGGGSLGSSTLLFSAVYATSGTIQTSDVRSKKDILESDLGLDFINKLRPVVYRWKAGPDQDLHYGLIAQEAEKTISEFHKLDKNENTPIVDHDKKNDKYGLRYSEFISPIIKAVQQLYGKYVSNDKAIKRLEAENALMKTYLCSKDPNAVFCR